MSQTLRKHVPFLKSLYKVNDIKKKQILKSKCCDVSFIRACEECIYNVLKGAVPLTPAQKRKLSRKKKLMRKFILKKTSLNGKAKILQTGGFLGALLGPIIRVIGSIFTSGDSSSS